MKKSKKTKSYALYNLLCAVKSVHLWAWIIFILGTVFCYYYPRIWEQHENFTEKAFALMEWYFIWMMSVGIWLLLYFAVAEMLD